MPKPYDLSTFTKPGTTLDGPKPLILVKLTPEALELLLNQVPPERRQGMRQSATLTNNWIPIPQDVLSVLYALAMAPDQTFSDTMLRVHANPKLAAEQMLQQEQSPSN